MDGGDHLLAEIELPADGTVGLTRAELRRRRDRFVILVMTPAILFATFVGVLAASQALDPAAEPLVLPTPVPAAAAAGTRRQPTPVAAITMEPIDPVRLGAGVVQKAPPFEWPEVENFTVVPEPARPNEQADYTPLISATELRRLIAVQSVNITLHSSAAFARGAALELNKSYPLRRTEQRVVDNTATLGYIPDESGIGLVYVINNYRIQIETIAAAPPITPGQQAEFEYHTLHLADHIARRAQETISARRNSAEATAVHWRDHILRQVPFGR